LKKFELEFSVDPLFKKASADFDEGGAKGLLLNHLAIDAEGRIVFDSSDDAEAVSGVEDATSSGNDAEAAEAAEGAADEDRVNGVDGDDMEIDIKSLQLKFFPDLNTLDGQDICPSLKTFDLGDPAAILDIPFLKASEDQKSGEDDSPLANLGDRSGIFLDGDNAFDDDDMGLSSADIPLDTEFGEGGEAWARNAALEPQNRLLDTNIEGVQNDGNHEQEFQLDGYDVAGKQHGISLQHIRSEGTHEDILSYFDNALRKNWAGPEHWRIRRMKDITKSSTLTPLKRKEKEPFEVDFIANLEPSLAELIYTPASSNSTISLPRTQWKSKNRNLLPDDKHFNSRQLLRFFLKPRARLGTRRILPNSRDDFAATKPTIELPDGEMDEAFWARQGNASHSINHEGDVAGNYDANFFQDDGLVFPGGPPDDDEDDFADAREAFSPGLDGVVNEGIPGMDGILTSADNAHVGGFGSQLVTQSKRLRPEYVQYARVAKKVDVRRLKEEIWKGIGLGEVRTMPHSYLMLANLAIYRIHWPKHP
jgi:condensin complex subunit 2